MLINYSMLGGRKSLKRLLVSGIIAITVVTLLLYVCLNYPHKVTEVNNINMDIKYFVTQIRLPNETDLIEDEIFEPLPHFEMELYEEKMNERRQYLKQACRHHRFNDTGDIDAENYFLYNKYNLAWLEYISQMCSVFKGASASWYYGFNLLPGFDEEEIEESETFYELARSVSPEPSLDDLMAVENKSTSMLIVQHPFQRLSMAYRDKIDNINQNDYYLKLAEEIIEKYRIDVKEAMNPWKPTFEEFVCYILDEATQEKELDTSWIPYTTYCTPCYYNFDTIVKFETLDADQKYILQKLGLNEMAKTLWETSKYQNKPINAEEIHNLVKSHYSQLDEDQITDLYQLYMYDFQLFDYTPYDYYDLAIKIERPLDYDYDSSDSSQST